MKQILDIIKFAKEQKLNFNSNLILTIFGSAIEVVTLSTFIPLIYLIIDFENIQKIFEKIKFLNFNYDIVFYKIIVLVVILIFTLGTILVFIIKYAVSNNLKKFSSFISYNILKFTLKIIMKR